MIELVIQEPIVSLNKTMKEHWSAKTKRRKTYEDQILFNFLIKYRYKDRQAALKRVKRKLRIHSQRSRLLDQDNLSGGAKTLLDALRKIGLIIDDNETWLESVEYTQATGKPYFTKIIIE